MRILVIEDEKKIASFIARGLKEQGHAVDIAASGEAGVAKALVNPYDLIILDIMLPGRDGISLCQEIREKDKDVFIMMLTARSRPSDKVEGLQAGADDYLAKPFDFDELLARIAALARRSRGGLSEILRVGDLEVNTRTQEVIRGGIPISLTAKEYALLVYLMTHSGRVVTRTMISDHVWNEEFDTFTNVIDVYVNYLRNKIDKPHAKPLIHTLRGTGYMLSENAP